MTSQTTWLHRRLVSVIIQGEIALLFQGKQDDGCEKCAGKTRDKLVTNICEQRAKLLTSPGGGSITQPPDITSCWKTARPAHPGGGSNHQP